MAGGQHCLRFDHWLSVELEAHRVDAPFLMRTPRILIGQSPDDHLNKNDPLGLRVEIRAPAR